MLLKYDGKKIEYVIFLILNLYKEMLNIENMYEIIAIILSFILNYAHSIKNSCYTILSYDLMMKFNML